MPESNTKDNGDNALSLNDHKDHKDHVNITTAWTEDVRTANNCCNRWWRKQNYAARSFFCLTIVLLCSLIFMINILAIYMINDRSFVKIGEKTDVCLSKGCVKAASSILDRIDFSVDPCTDFYSFACGNFLKSHTVPDDHYHRNLLQEMQDDVYIEMKHYLQEPIEDSDGSSIRQIKLLYKSCMNESTENDEQQSMKTVLDLLELIGGEWSLLTTNVRSDFQLEYRLASLLMYKVHPLFQIFITALEKNASQYSLYMFSGSTVLESAYFANASNESHYLHAYINLQLEVLKLFANFKGIDETQLDPMAVLNDITEMVQFEYDLANITRDIGNDHNLSEYINVSEDDGYDIELSHEENFVNVSNMPFTNFTIDKLDEEFGTIKWKQLFSYIFEPLNVKRNEILIHSKDYLIELIKLLDRYSPKTIDNFLCWTFISRYMPYLGPQFRRLFSDFRTRVPDITAESGDPSGSTRIFLSRWKECVHVACEGLDIPAVILYLKHKKSYLNSVTERIHKMIKNIKESFSEIIDSQDWIKQMSVKEKFKIRSNGIESKIGVPQYLFDTEKIDESYRDLGISPNDVFISNVFKMTRNDMITEVKKLNQDVNPDAEWLFQPLIANAFYEPASNTMSVVIGHEIAHSLESNSRKYMSYANGTSWWSNDVYKDYREKAKCFAQQYSGYFLEKPGEYLNGNLTLEENICDFAGLQQAYYAYKKLLIDDPKLPGLNEFTSGQLFFIQYSQLWCEISNSEGNKRSLYDNHSPGRFRANGVLINSPHFAKEFNCAINSSMNPQPKCNLWISSEFP